MAANTKTPAADADEITPAADVDESAQESAAPAAPVAGDLVECEATGRYGIVIDAEPHVVLWLGVPERCDLPLRRVG
ncbi:hypothetical protein C5N14_30945 [Micromonospora sp. MW-13]|uniref:hypothetical protein n=1 Tax=Micromonospora sp. MW-13 TaxID=2094022 RepID=UPI000E43915E|nr:hypothetical protein [Micromonospora sp. MW-13]RGC65011.1 hypothetical protein C5N14_30945 [Micromonospora sp. MW-13]